MEVFVIKKSNENIRWWKWVSFFKPLLKVSPLFYLSRREENGAQLKRCKVGSVTLWWCHDLSSLFTSWSVRYYWRKLWGRRLKGKYLLNRKSEVTFFNLSIWKIVSTKLQKKWLTVFHILSIDIPIRSLINPADKIFLNF